MQYSSDFKLFKISRGIDDNMGNETPGRNPNDTSFTFDANKYNEYIKIIIIQFSEILYV